MAAAEPPAPAPAILYVDTSAMLKLLVRAVHDLALRGADAIRAEQQRRQEGLEFLRRLDAGEDDRFDFSISARLHAER